MLFFCSWSHFFFGRATSVSEVVQVLLDKGSDIGLQNKDGKSALAMATEKGHADVVQLLQESESKLDQNNEGEWSL